MVSAHTFCLRCRGGGAIYYKTCGNGTQRRLDRDNLQSPPSNFVRVSICTGKAACSMVWYQDLNDPGPPSSAPGNQAAPTIQTTSTDIANGSTLSVFHMNFAIGNTPLTTWSCTLDGAPYSCPDPYHVSIGPVAYSGHSFRITVQNYGGAASTGSDWVGGG
jgi:hypothetical protein